MNDLADVIENTRSVKRRLCVGPLNYSPDRVFQGEFLDIPALETLRDELQQSEENSPEPGECRECAVQLQTIIDTLRANPVRPTDRDLCERFVGGKIDARTALQITGWTPVELYDACAAFGLDVDIRS